MGGYSVYQHKQIQRKQSPVSTYSAPSKAPLFQPKLAINAPNDIYEQEAERVADQVMRMPAPSAAIQRVPIGIQRCAKCAAATRIEDMCPSCAAKAWADARVQRSATSAVPEVTPLIEANINALRGGGQPLDDSVRAFMEPRFGHDFNQVRVHSDAQAARSAADVGALAYTIGRDVVFGAGKYQPGTDVGKRLIAHELTHVVQQIYRHATPDTISRDDLDGGLPPGGTPTESYTPPRTLPISLPPPHYHPGVNHNHKPSGRWGDVQANPNSGFWENRACANLSPEAVVGLAIWAEFDDKPIALEHLNWYLSTGNGMDFNEDRYIDMMLRIDKGVQYEFAIRTTNKQSKKKISGHFKLEQGIYQNQDFRYAFGAIDRFDFEADYATNTLRAWFQDRYEWHPVYPFYSHFHDDEARETNCVHAALVELKAGGAAKDYWMKGVATVPLGVVMEGANDTTDEGY